MPIPASYIVKVVPRLMAAGGTDLEFNGLILTKNQTIPAPALCEEFTSAEAVAEYFGRNSSEYAAAVQYFCGYNNSFRKPARLFFGSRIDAARGAFIRSGAMTDADLATLIAISDGALVFNAGGSGTTVSSIDLTSCTSFSDIATTIQTKLTAASVDFAVAFSSIQNKFTFTDNSTGSTSTVDFAGAPSSGTNLAAALKLTAARGAVLSQGVNALSVSANMNYIKAASQNWVTFTTLWSAVDSVHLDAAAWATAQGVDYLYVGWSTDGALAAGPAGNIAEQISAANYGATAMVYGPKESAIFVLGMVASIDWERWQGVISTAFKHADGLAPAVTTESTAAILDGLRVNYIGKFATRNDDFTFFYSGAMFGDYRWIDSYVNAIWLKNVIQLSCMAGLTSVGRVPYNERGYTLIRAWLQDPLNRAIKNGAIDAGMVLSESQKAQATIEAGRDISSELWLNGYYVQVSDAGAAVRVNRDSPNIAIWYTYSGSVNRLNIPVTLIA